MRFSRLTTSLALVAFSIGAPLSAAVPTIEESFVVNAQYRNGINKNFNDIGSGYVRYRKGPGSKFALAISGSMKNPENGELYKMRVMGEFLMEGRAVTKLAQKVEMNEEARRYEKLMTENLPFVFLARFQSLPPGAEADDVVYRYEGRDYKMRYVPLGDSVEATLYQGDIQIGKFFLDGRSGQPPRGLAKARMIGPDHLVFSLVINPRPDAARGE